MGGLMKSILAIVALMTLGACASATAVAPRVELIDSPPVAQLARAELGDTILEKGKLSTYEGLRLKNELTWGDGFFLKKFTISPGRLRATHEDKNFLYYRSEAMTSYDAMIGTFPYPGGLCVNHANRSVIQAFIQVGVCNITPNVAPDVERLRVTDVDAPNFRQELIYNGRSGDTIKFLYREFAGDYARAPFSQEVQYDLKDGNTIGFKGARIEIVEATNTNLSYRVVSSFPDPLS
jgi:hypothetical protein